MPNPHYSRTRFSNLVRSDASGKYYVRATVHGRKVFKSLRTKSIEIAVAKLADVLDEERGRPHPNHTDSATLGDLLAEWLLNAQKSRLRESTKESYGYVRFALAKCAPEALKTPAVEITTEDVKGWIAKVQQRYCADNTNKALAKIKRALDLAVKRGIILKNPASPIPLYPLPLRERPIPTEDQLRQLFAALKARKHRSGSYWLASFLCYSGFRLGTARLMTPANIDRVTGHFVVPGRWLKTGDDNKIYRFPILPRMAVLLDELDGEFGKDRERLLPTRSAWDTLRRICRKLKMPVLDHHAFRHIFSTACIAAGVPVPIIAEWRGDRDGGRTLLRVYHHLLDETSRKYAQQVNLP